MMLFEASCEASLHKCAEVRRQMKRRLGDLRMPKRSVETAQLVFSEISANLLKHSSPAPSRIDVKVKLDGTALQIEIEDDGAAFVGFDACWQHSNGIEMTTLETSGRGLALIATTVETASYRAGAPNRFTASIKLYLKKPAILLVEDSSPLLAMYQTILRPLYEVLTATTLASAIAVARTNPVEAIIADFHLGDGDGTSLIDVLDEDETRPPAPIIILTGDHDPDTHALALRRGVDRFLIKPIQAKTLRTAVADALARSRRHNARAYRYFCGTVQAASQIPATLDVTGFLTATLSGTAALGSGDFLLNLPLAGGRRLILADVMGHGLGAQAAGSAFAAMLRTVHALQITPTPGAYLNAVSTVMMIDPLMQNHMMTLLVADVFDDGAVTFANAGHPRPLLARHGAIETIETEGPLPGLIAEHHYEDTRLKLAAGDRLVFTTDGLDPRGSQSGIDAPEWLVGTLAGGVRSGFDGLRDAMRRATEHHIGTQSDDDWTIIALEHAAPAAQAA
ncbi:MAG: SpoIIE family protein phosphatase [Beijerinckiaceae bacterium]|nr:SpoIIE family protein phosphatase [Beijerinckiaceae bacterium]